jgi:hypothetical protein
MFFPENGLHVPLLCRYFIDIERAGLNAYIENSVKGSRDLLEGVYRETPRTLAQFGFDITESARSAGKKTEK